MLQLKSYRSDDDSDVHSASEINQMLHEKEKPIQTRTLISIDSVEHTDNSQDSVSGNDSSNSSKPGKRSEKPISESDQIHSLEVKKRKFLSPKRKNSSAFDVQNPENVERKKSSSLSPQIRRTKHNSMDYKH